MSPGNAANERKAKWSLDWLTTGGFIAAYINKPINTRTLPRQMEELLK